MDTKNVGGEELKEKLVESSENASDLMVAMGITEIVLGLLAMFLASLTGAFFIVLLGAAILVSGILGIITSIAKNNLSRFVVGLVSMGAGVLVIASPQAGLSFLAALIAIYLIVTGLSRLFGKERALLTRLGGILGMVLGIVVLVQLSTISAPLIGLLVGVNILIEGILTIVSGRDLSAVARQMARHA